MSHKPVARFIGDMVYGIMVEKDVKLSSIGRALKEKPTPKTAEDRLSRMLSSDGLEAGLHGFIASEGAKKVHRDTLIILDPSDVQKSYAKKNDSSFPLPDFHLAQNENGDFTLWLQGCRCFSLQKLGASPTPTNWGRQPDSSFA